jgi:hypothetical protein
MLSSFYHYTAYGGFGSMLGIIFLLGAVFALAYGFYLRHCTPAKPRFSFGLTLAPPGTFDLQPVAFVGGVRSDGTKKHRFRNLFRTSSKTDRGWRRSSLAFGAS